MLVYLGFAFVDSAWGLVALFLGYGIFYAAADGVIKAWITALVPVERRGQAFALNAAASGLLLLPASVIAGALWDTSGPRAAFLFGAVVAAGRRCSCSRSRRACAGRRDCTTASRHDRRMSDDIRAEAEQRRAARARGGGARADLAALADLRAGARLPGRAARAARRGHRTRGCGPRFHSEVIVVGGLAETFAAALSMGTGSFLASRAQNQVSAARDRAGAARDRGRSRARDRRARADPVRDEGLEREQAAAVAQGSPRPGVFLRTKVQKELGLSFDPAGGRGDAIVIGSAYWGGAVPLWPYFFFSLHVALAISLVCTLVALIGVGVAKGLVTRLSLARSATGGGVRRLDQRGRRLRDRAPRDDARGVAAPASTAATQLRGGARPTRGRRCRA